jgi:hypothetical protein
MIIPQQQMRLTLLPWVDYAYRQSPIPVTTFQPSQPKRPISQTYVSQNASEKTFAFGDVQTINAIVAGELQVSREAHM